MKLTKLCMAKLYVFAVFPQKVEVEIFEGVQHQL